MLTRSSLRTRTKRLYADASGDRFFAAAPVRVRPEASGRYRGRLPSGVRSRAAVQGLLCHRPAARGVMHEMAGQMAALAASWVRACMHRMNGQ